MGLIASHRRQVLFKGDPIPKKYKRHGSSGEFSWRSKCRISCDHTVIELDDGKILTGKTYI
jgi:mRNA-degrading endonuclease YafQ of YafQ-DinJ toxin-antitoxin module